METHSHFFPTNGITLHVVEAGEASGTAVVWLHGIWDRWMVWEDVVPYLPGRHLMVELRGHGESEKPEGAAHYRLADYAADIAGLLDLLDLRGVTLVGFSLGGLIATVLAAQEPARIARVVLVDPPYRETAEPFTELTDMRDLRHESTDDIAAMLTFLRPERIEAERVREAAWLRMTADGAFDALIAGTYGPFILRDLLAQIAQPCLLLQADPLAGGALSDAMVQRALAFLPRAAHVRFPGSGHNIMHDQPEALIAAVRAFLAPGV